MLKERKFYISKERLEKIKEEYQSLKKLRNSKTSEGAPGFLESEDLNPEFIAFKEDLFRIDSSIEELENVLKNAVIIDSEQNPSAGEERNNDVVRVGSKILVEINGKTQNQFTLVGTLEAEPVSGKISNESPVGRALLGHRPGEVIKISFPVKTTYKIIKILS